MFNITNIFYKKRSAGDRSEETPAPHNSYNNVMQVWSGGLFPHADFQHI